MLYELTWKIISKINPTKISGPQLQPADTAPIDQEIENLNSNLDFPMVEVDENADFMLAARQFLEKEGSKGNPRVVCRIVLS